MRLNLKRWLVCDRLMSESSSDLDLNYERPAIGGDPVRVGYGAASRAVSGDGTEEGSIGNSDSGGGSSKG